MAEDFGKMYEESLADESRINVGKVVKGTVIDVKDDEIILNAEISQLLFKKKFTIALKAYDILNQAKNLSITDNANYHQEVRNNTLGRYVIMSLTYRFGNMSNGPGRRGPGGPGFRGPRR
jgi:hypothetical protein